MQHEYQQSREPVRRYASQGRRRSEPRRSAEQDSPSPERPETVQEEHRVSPRDLEDPPQAEGDRDDVEDGD